MISCSDGNWCVEGAASCPDGRSSFDPNWVQTIAATPRSAFQLPQDPKFDCRDMKLDDRGMVICERYASQSRIEFPINYRKTQMSFDKSSLQQYKGQVHVIPIKEFGTGIQDQGQEGACTAFGMTHTVQVEAGKLEKGVEYSAPNFWRTYARATMEDAKAAA